MGKKKATILRGNERKKRKKNRYAKLNRGRWRRYIYTSKINCKGKRTIGKANKGINIEKNLIDLKNLKREKKKGKLHRTAKAQVEVEVYINNKKFDRGKKSSKLN